MGGQEHRLAERLQALDHAPGLAPGGRVEPGGRLVQEQQIRVAHQGEGNVELAQLPTRQRAGPGLRLAAQPDLVDGLADIARPGVIPRVSLHQFPDGQFGGHVRGLQDEPDPGPPGQRRMGRIRAQHADVARVPPAVPLQHLHGRGLARAVRAQEREYLAVLHGKVDAPNRLDVPVSLP